MRVIAGTARSMPLSTPKGDATRPTTDRIKETLFNMLQSYVPGCVFVDAFAGSGGIGIEALSRGARHAYFIDNSAESIKCITDNLKFTRLDDKATILRSDISGALRLIKEDSVDVIFADPPYMGGYEYPFLSALSGKSFVTNDTIIIVESDLDTDVSFASGLGFDIIKEKCYKTNKHVWLNRSGRPD